MSIQATAFDTAPGSAEFIAGAGAQGSAGELAQFLIAGEIILCVLEGE
jgi:hypothetical protein